MENKFDILNSEGSILGLYIDENDKYYFSSFLEDGSGTIFYEVSLDLIYKYFNSILNLKQVVQKSSDFIVRHKYKNEEKSFLKDDLIDKIQSLNTFYNDKSNSMKNIEFEKWAGNLK